MQEGRAPQQRSGEPMGISLEGVHLLKIKPGETVFSSRRSFLAGTVRVGEKGVEPSHPYGYRNLNPARLPIPPLAREEELFAH